MIKIIHARMLTYWEFWSYTTGAAPCFAFKHPTKDEYQLAEEGLQSHRSHSTWKRGRIAILPSRTASTAFPASLSQSKNHCSRTCSIPGGFSR